MTEQRVPYLLQTVDKNATMEQEPIMEPIGIGSQNIEWLEIERMLIPLLNRVRKAQGKKPIILPR